MTNVQRIAKIKSTRLGTEGHGIATVMLHVDYGGSGQGVGGYALDEPTSDDEGHFTGRAGTAFGMEWIKRCMSACGVDSWEDVAGRTVLVLFDEDSWNAQPIGLAPLPTEKGEAFMFAELSKQFYPDEANKAA